MTEHTALDAAVDGDAEATAELERLRAENEALKKDAERYKWLRENADMQFGQIDRVLVFQPTTHSLEWVDLKIDALRGEGEG